LARLEARVQDYCYQQPSEEGNGGIEREMRIRRIVNLTVQVLLSINHEVRTTTLSWWVQT